MNNNGFTLIEMLVVLSIISIVIFISVPIQFSSLIKQEEQQFIDQLKNDVLLIQNQTSINSKERMYIRFYDGYYSIIQGRNPTFAHRDYPDGWNVINTNIRLEFAESGSVVNPRTIVMYSETERIAIVFPLGKGRFYIDKRERILTN